MVAGFIGGCFELGLGSILPLYGLALSLPESQAALLVALSGAGGTLAAMPSGLIADRFADPQKGRRRMMQLFTVGVLLASVATLLIPQVVWLIWPVVALWGAAGGTLYTLSMIDIGAREKGVTLVNSTAVLVLTYTLGGLVSSAVSGAMLDWSLQWAFPVWLMLVAAAGVWAQLRP
jgi:MFS family permease